MSARSATKQLQEEQLTLGDFYGVWTRCLLETKRIKSPLSAAIVTAMENRQTKLFDNPIVLAGMFLDCRFNVVLSEEQNDRAQQHLLRTWGKIIAIETHCTPASTETRSVGNAAMEDEMDVLMKTLKEKIEKLKNQI